MPYTKIMDPEGNANFVRTKDFRKYKKMLKDQAPAKQVAGQMFKMLLNSPDGMTKMHDGIMIVLRIQEIKSISMLKNMGQIIDHRIQMLRKKKVPKKKSKKKKVEKKTKRESSGITHRRDHIRGLTTKSPVQEEILLNFDLAIKEMKSKAPKKKSKKKKVSKK